MSTSQDYVSARATVLSMLKEAEGGATISTQQLLDRLQEQAVILAQQEKARSRVQLNIVAMLDQMAVCSADGDRGITEQIASALMKRFTITEQEEPCPF